MANVSMVIKGLLGGGDTKVVREVATVVVDAYSRIMGEPYQLSPVKVSATSKSKTISNRKPIKKSKRWGKVIESIDYGSKPTGYSIKGNWANVFDLSKHPNGTLVMVSIPNTGLFMGEVTSNKHYGYKYPNGSKGEIKHFSHLYGTDEGMYENIINECKSRKVPDAKKAVV